MEETRQTIEKICRNLDRHRSISKNLPEFNRRRIFGTENEFGVVEPEFSRLPSMGFVDNGGKIYEDCGHIEWASPETASPLEAVIYEKAGELIALQYARKLYKNNVDSEGHTYGAHENYFTKASSLEQIIPFLITRQIYAGAGVVRQDGRFEISQRADHIRCAVSDTTTTGRAILCTRQENLADVDGWHRLHLIVGDANMCEVADFLKLGTTALVLDLAEDKLLPKFEYDLDKAVSDLQQIACKTSGWLVYGTYRNTEAVTIQRKYLATARKHYAGRDQITDEILVRWHHVLNVLERDPMELVGTIDWVTKKALIEAYAKKNNLPNYHPIIRNIDLQYHDLDREKGLFYVLQTQGKIERLVTDALIEAAVDNPPQNTRAFFRGNLVREFGNGNSSKVLVGWDNYGVGTWVTETCCSEGCRKFEYTSENLIENPFDNYAHLLKKVVEEIRN